MSPRSAYLRDQADRCQRHATALSDTYTQAELRKLAVEYIERAAEIEAAEIEAKAKAADPRPPSLWLPSQIPDGEPAAG
jgi:hypothetical protein